MNKLILLIILFSSLHTEAQTLFTYGDYEVSRQEFLRAYNKNNNNQQPTEKTYRDYLELYLRFKLKLQAALDRKMDTLPSQQAELQSFRNQIAEGFMIDDSTVHTLVNEAFERSRKDIHIAHIFIPFKSPFIKGATERSEGRERSSAQRQEDLADTSLAFQKVTDAYNELKRGTDFGNVARIYSADSSAQSRRGDIGFITAFTLPYPLETIVYNISRGSFSQPYRSKAGYHIFKNIEERPAAGKMKAAQILLLFPPEAGESIKNVLKLRADSIYKVLRKGGSFEALAKQYSNDNLTYLAGGEMPEFTAGKYEPAFEKAIFSLTKNGDITPPVLTELGYHIVKRLALTPVSKDSANAMDILRQQVLSDSRMSVARKVMIEKVYHITGRDSATVNEHQLLDLYRDSLEQYNPEFAMQMQEFKAGNLLFDIMQSNVWDKAANDSAGLRKYYLANKDKYTEPFNKVKGAVLNDYQAFLEEQWIAELKRKYPVKINGEVLKSL